MAGKSEAIWINRKNSRDNEMSSSFGRGNLFGIQRSMSVASDGTATNSPAGSYSDPFEPPFPGRRMRTSSFSGNSDDDGPWSIPMSTSAPQGNQSWRRSNSVSYGADKNPLGRIEEHGRMSAFGGFGDTIKKSMDKLFFQPTKQNSFGGQTGNDSKQKKNGQVKDQVVSMLCEGALR